PHPGRYTLLVDLIGPVGGDLARDQVRLPIEVLEPARRRRGAGAERELTMTTLLQELGSKLRPDAQRALRLAGEEMRRLGHLLVQHTHLVIGLRRVVRKGPDLPTVQHLRDATEQLGGLTLAAGGLGPYRVAPGTAARLR